MTTVRPTGAALADRFWRRVLHEVEEMTAEEGRGREGGPEQPLPVAVRRAVPRHPLPPPAAVLGDPRSSFAMFRTPSGGGHGRLASGPLDRAGVSTLLYYAYGLVRLEVGRGAHWPYHRTVASARCFFPTELYCVLPATGDLPAGAYAYDPAHHALVALRQGDLRGALGAAVGTALTATAGALVLSTVFWRTAFMYRNYAYRLVTQEAGLLAGNALLVAGALGLRGRLCHRFDPAAVEALLGICWPEESALSVLALDPGLDADSPRARPTRADVAAAGSRAETGGTPAPTDDHQLDPELFATLLDLDAAARAEASGDHPPAAVPATGAVAAAGVDGAAGVVEDGDLPDLADVLRRRNSGGDVFNPLRRPVPLAVVSRVVRYALDRHDSDATAEGTGPPLSCYVWTPSVSDAPPAVYRLTGGRLVPLVDGARAALRLQEIVDRSGTATNVNYRTANLVAFVVADLAAGVEMLGARSVRVLSQEAGVVAQRICVLSAAESLSARIHNGYRSHLVAEALGLPSGHEPLFQIIVGSIAPTTHYQARLGGVW